MHHIKLQLRTDTIVVATQLPYDQWYASGRVIKPKQLKTVGPSAMLGHAEKLFYLQGKTLVGSPNVPLALTLNSVIFLGEHTKYVKLVIIPK